MSTREALEATTAAAATGTGTTRQDCTDQTHSKRGFVCPTCDGWVRVTR